MACELYCCLLPQCEALRLCRSGFPIATELTGIIIALEHTLCNNRRVLMRTSYSLLRNYRYIATIVLARIKANGNFIDASLERMHSVSGLGINGVLSPSDAFDLESPLN